MYNIYSTITGDLLTRVYYKSVYDAKEIYTQIKNVIEKHNHYYNRVNKSKKIELHTVVILTDDDVDITSFIISRFEEIRKVASEHGSVKVGFVDKVTKQRLIADGFCYKNESFRLLK